MLRYNNNNSKPVDFYRPLTVDVSVEYELPKEVAPPKGSAPLLIIHPSAYLKNRGNSSSSPITNQNSSSRNQTSRQYQNSINNRTTYSNSSTNSSRFNDLASTLYHLTSNTTVGKQSTRSYNNSSNLGHDSSTSNSLFTHNGNSNSNNGGGSTGRITRSKAALKQMAQINCDQQYPLPPSNNNRSFHGTYLPNTSSSTSTTDQQKTISSKKSSTRNGISETYSAHSLAEVQQTQSSSTYNGLGPTTRSGGTAKRFRLMTQQQQGVIMEPLNLALATSSDVTSQQQNTYNNQFTSFLAGYSLASTLHQHGNSPQTSFLYQGSGSNNGGLTNNSNNTGRITRTNILKKDGPVPVDKGSGGSDSGVCSENESDDISPPMAALASTNSGGINASSSYNSTTTTNHTRTRSNLTSSQEISGCYCCCCPPINIMTTSNNHSSSSVSSSYMTRSTRNSNKSSKLNNSSSSLNPTCSTLSNRNHFGTSYPNFLSNVIQSNSNNGNTEISNSTSLIHNSLLIDPLNNCSPMDSSGSPLLYSSTTHNPYSSSTNPTRKWFPMSTSNILLATTADTSIGVGGGRWYQV